MAPYSFKYWVSPLQANWSSANWAYSSGGPAIASPPGPGDIAVFDSCSLGMCITDSTVNIAGLRLMWGFPSTLMQGPYPINIGSQDASFDGGFFRGSKADINIEGSFSLTASEFKSTKGTLTVRNNFYFYDATVVPESIGTVYSDEFVLSDFDIENKYVTLIDDPTKSVEDPTANVAVTIEGGSAQYDGIDFYMDENLLRWDGMQLEQKLAPGDILRVVYHAGYEPGTFVHRNGKVKLLATNNRFHGGGIHFYDLEVSSAGIPGQNFLQIDSSCYVSHYLFLSGGSGLTQGIGDGTNPAVIFLSGDMTGSANFGSLSPLNNARIDMTSTPLGASPTQRIHWKNGAVFPSLYVDKHNPLQYPYRDVRAVGPGDDLRFCGDCIIWDGTFNLQGHDLKVGNVP